MSAVARTSCDGGGFERRRTLLCLIRPLLSGGINNIFPTDVLTLTNLLVACGVTAQTNAFIYALRPPPAHVQSAAMSRSDVGLIDRVTCLEENGKTICLSLRIIR